MKECFGSSDHAMITFYVSIPSAKIESRVKEIPLLSKAKWRLFQEVLMESYWPGSSSFGIDELWNIYRSNILKAANASIPQVVKRDWKAHNSSKVRTALRRHRRLCGLLRGTSSFSSKLRIKASISSLNKVVYDETCEHELRISKALYADPKPYWSNVKSKTNLSDTISVIKDSSGK